MNNHPRFLELLKVCYGAIQRTKSAKGWRETVKYVLETIADIILHVEFAYEKQNEVYNTSFPLRYILHSICYVIIEFEECCNVHLNYALYSPHVRSIRCRFGAV